MKQKLMSIAHEILRDMYQLLREVNTTVVLTDKNGTIVDLLCNVYASQDYMIMLKIGDRFNEWSAGDNAVNRALVYNELSETSSPMHIFKKTCDIFSVAMPLHNSDDGIVGCLGIFGPQSEEHLDRARASVKITAAALEGQWKAMEYKSDFDRVYNQLLGTMETIPIGTVVTDNMMTILHVNDALLKIFDVQIKDIIGKNADLYFRTGGFFKKMLDEGRTTLDEEMEFRMPDGTMTCEVIVSLVKGEESESKGLVIKLKSAKYMNKFKKSKDLHKAHFQFEDIIGTSQAIREAIRLGKIAARSTSNVLILGESGTGKELFAQSIHNHSIRREGPFVAVNCGALPGGLIESELFGYEGGAFTGARKEGQAGKFEQANGGTLFLDEIGDMPIHEQISLLRVLQNKEVVRIGGNRTIKINVRVIAATNLDIEKEVLQAKFRKDLYYRLNVFSILLPSLAARIQDILPMAEIFISKYNVRLNKEITGIDPHARRLLLAHAWPGNVRELENVIERAVNICKGSVICPTDLPDNFRGNTCSDELPEDADSSISPGKDALEKMAIINALEQCGGNISRVSDMIGLGRRSLYRRMEAYGIDWYSFKSIRNRNV